VTVLQQIATELGVGAHQVQAAVDLLDGGATVPFIARYRKEATGTLDDAQLRTLEERLRYLRELEERRAVILESIRSQGKLTTRCGRRSDADSRPASRTSTCRTSRSGGPRRRSRAWLGLQPLPTLRADPAMTQRAHAGRA
jgi:uncharacterized protein